MQLLIIPAVLAIAGYVINIMISRSEQNVIERRAETDQYLADWHAGIEHEIAFDNQREAALQAFIDKMSELLL